MRYWMYLTRNRIGALWNSFLIDMREIKEAGKR